MRLSSTLIVFCTALHILPCICQENGISRIECRKNEKWWGLSPSLGRGGYFREPFEITTDSIAGRPERRTAFFSDNGRYVTADFPAGIMFDGTAFEIVSGAGPVEARKAGRTLREAYLVYANRQGAEIPREVPPDLLALPVYDLRPALGGSHSQNEVLELAAMLERRGLPPGILLIPDGWQSVNSVCAFDPELYPDPTVMVSRLHGLGYKIMLTVTPYLTAAGKAYADNTDAGNLLLDSDGKPLVFSVRRGYCCSLDITRNEVAAELERRADSLARRTGIDGFYYDCHEITALLTIYPEKRTAFSTNWNNTGRNAALRLHNPAGGGPGLYTGGTLSWASLKKAVEEIPAAGICGTVCCGFVFEPPHGEPDTTLLLRAAALGAVMPVAVIPVARLQNDGYYASLAETARQRAAMGEYMGRLAAESGLTGEPVARYMEYQYPKNGFANCNDQFAIGPGYVAAPAVEASGIRMVRLPRGVWNGPDGRRYKGPRVVEIDAGAVPAAVFEAESRK